MGSIIPCTVHVLHPVLFMSIKYCSLVDCIKIHPPTCENVILMNPGLESRTYISQPEAHCDQPLAQFVLRESKCSAKYPLFLYIPVWLHQCSPNGALRTRSDFVGVLDLKRPTFRGDSGRLKGGCPRWWSQVGADMRNIGAEVEDVEDQSRLRSYVHAAKIN